MEKLSCEELIKLFVEDLNLRQRSRDTVKLYPIIVRAFCRSINGRVLELTKDDLRAYLNELIARKFKKSSIVKHFVVLNSFYDFLYDSDIYPFNPIPSFRKRYLSFYNPRSTEGKRRCPTTEEASRLVNSILKPRDQAIVILLFKTGIRRKELSELDASDVDMANRTIILKRTAKRSNRKVFFDEEAAYVLNRWLKRREVLNKKGNPALFIGQSGDRLTLRPINVMFNGYAKTAGLTNGEKIEEKLTPHCCRHFFTNELLEAGMPREHIQFLRGDRGKEAIDIYHHINEKKLQEEYEKYIPQLGVL